MADTPGAIQVLVLQRGWVVVGRVSKHDDHLRVTDANVVRYWGTTRGLGELATSGPLSGTKLDPSPPITAHVLTVVMAIDCEDTVWTSKLR